MDPLEFKQKEKSVSINNSLCEIKIDANNQSSSILSDRNDSKQEFFFGKFNKQDKKQGLHMGQIHENSIEVVNDSNVMLFSSKQKIMQSQYKSNDEDENKNDQIKSSNEIQGFQENNQEINKITFDKLQERNLYRNKLNYLRINRNISQVHSMEKSPTMQSPDESQGMYNSMKKSSMLKSKLQLQNNFSMNSDQQKMFRMSSLKQKLTLSSSPNKTPSGDKVESSTFIGNAMKQKFNFRWNFVNKLEKVQNFIFALKNTSTIASSFRSLNLKHHELIGDKADIHNEYSQKISNKFKLLFDNTIKKMPIFSPESPNIIMWNFLVAICILQQYVVIPLKISFFIDFQGAYVELLLFYLPAIIFILEIFIRLNISFYEEGILVQSRFKIIFNYMFKTYFFWLDLITTITLLISKESNHPLLVIVVVLRILQLSQLVNDIDEHYQITQRFSSQWNLLKLLLLILMLAHFTGCGFHYIAYVQSEDGTNTWLDKQKIFTEDWQLRYLNSVYWASITMITVGYGDIVPITPAEKLYVIIMTLISAGVFGYSINTIGAIFGEIQKQKVVMKLNLFIRTQKRHISSYMRSRGINGQLQIEVLKYLDNVKQEEIEIAKKGQDVISKLSQSIQEKLFADYYGRILNESSVFKGYSISFLQEVTEIMKEQLYGPGEIIFSLGQYDDRMLFITKGKVQLFLPQAKHIKPIALEDIEEMG